MMFTCEQCNASFSRKTYLSRHKNEVHLKIPQKYYHQTHGSHINCTQTLPQVTQNEITRLICETAFQDAIRIIRFIPQRSLQPVEFFELALPLMESTVSCLREEKLPLKICCNLSVTFTNGERTDESYFSIRTYPILLFNLRQTILSLQQQVDDFIKRGSHWKLSKVNFFQMIVSLYDTI